MELDDERVPERSARGSIAQDDPPRMAARVSARRIRDVYGPIPACALRGELANGDRGRPIGRDSVGAARRVLRTTEAGEQHGTHRSPRRVEQPEAPLHASYDTGAMTPDEIEQCLIAIVEKEKKFPAQKLTRDTPLADAGIDSLDSLTILFAIEEELHISIPDEDARAIRTFGDLVDVVRRLAP